ncbi:hypothetical protein [Rhizobium leguminosarum]
MEQTVPIDEYLARRHKYMRLPRFLASVLVVLLVFLAVGIVVAITVVSSFSAITPILDESGIHAAFSFTTPALAMVITAVPFICGGILIVSVLAFCYRQAFGAFKPVYLFPGLVISAIAAAFDLNVTAIMILLVVAALAGYIFFGRRYVASTPVGRVLVDAPRGISGLLSKRYNLATIAVVRPLANLLLQLSKLCLVVLAAIALLMVAPAIYNFKLMNDRLSEAFSKISTEFGDTSTPPLASEPRGIPNPNAIIWIAYVIWLRPYLAGLAVSAKRRFKADVVRSATELFERDRRPGILLLRSFNDDRLKVTRGRSAVEWLLGVPPEAPARLEEMLAEVAFRFGPVAALKNPHPTFIGDDLGAARDVSTNEAWQDYVQTKLSSVRDVIVILGQTDGLRWEMQTIAEYGLIDKLIVIVPSNPKWTEEAVHEALPNCFGLSLGTDLSKAAVLSRYHKRAHIFSCTSKNREAYEEVLLLALTTRRKLTR